MTEPACLRLPLRAYPGMNPFVIDWLEENPKATALLPRRVERQGSRKEISGDWISALRESNLRWGIDSAETLRRWSSGESVTIVAGQQTGFAGGPLYTLAKLATLVRMKREFEQSGKAVALFFWLATEDHDYSEVAQLALQRALLPGNEDRQRDLLVLRERLPADNRLSVGPLPVPEALIRELLSLYSCARPSWLRAGISFRDSFAELVASLFGSQIVLIDALLPELRLAGAPLFHALQQRWEELQQLLESNAAALQEAGYEPQVLPRPGQRYTLLFERDAQGCREIVASPRELPPERTSTAALTRPLLQDFLLQPDLFVGGPSEVAYYAQLRGAHSMLSLREPAVALRGHLLVASKRVLRSVQRYGITAEELFSSADSIAAAREQDQAGEITHHAEKGREELLKRIEAISQRALPADHALARAVTRSIGHIEYHFAKLTERAVRAVARKDRERHEAAREVVSTLFPDGQVQDRVAAWLPYWCRHEGLLIERMVSEIEPDVPFFKVVAL